MASPNQMVSNKPIIAQLTNKTRDGLREFVSRAQNLISTQTSLRSSMEDRDRAYMRENNYTREQGEARMANWRGDARKIQDVTVPIVMPQVESALTYYENVFTTGYPVFGVATDPSNASAGMQIEAIIGENSVTAGWIREMIMFFRDGLKYNIHALECEWTQRVVYSTANDPGSAQNGGRTKKTIWNGNSLKRVDMYNAIFDPRVDISKIYEDGEFAGYIKMMGRTAFLKFISEMLVPPRDEDVAAALESGLVTGGVNFSSPYGYYQPNINPLPMMSNNDRGSFNWLNWAQDIKGGRTSGLASGMYEVVKLYARIIPKDYDIQAPDSSLPQVWKLYLVNRQVLLLAERQSNAHNMIPIFFGQPNEDGLYMQTKSFSQNVEDMQSISSAMANGYLASMRRNVSDRGIYNPMAISHKDMTSVDPAAKFAVKPAWYGKELKDAYFPIPYRADNAVSLLQGVGTAVNWANTVNGQNPAQQGQFVKGNKTQSEYDDVMGHGNGRNQLMCQMTEAQVMTPLKSVILLNILQFQQNGTIFSNNPNQPPVDIDVTALRESAVNFKISDGTLPTDKLMDADTFTMALQVIGSSQNIAPAFNMGPLFSYLMKEKNVDLTPFMKSSAQQMYEQQLNAWEQAAMAAAKAGTPFSTPMPQPSPQLQQEMQAAQQNGGVLPGSSNSEKALALTQGGTPGTVQRPQAPPGQPPAGNSQGQQQQTQGGITK